MTQSFENFDKPYRRGLVLGLSLAETFLILLFLLLLASMGLIALSQEELDETKEVLQETREELAEVKKENQKLRDGLEAIYNVAGREITIEEFTRLVKEAGANQELISEIEALKDQLAVERELKETLQEIIEAQSRKIEETQDTILKQAQIIDEYTKKGQDPPCWFIKVPDSEAVGGTRERHVKIFDVKIEDDVFIVRWHDNSNINLTIEKGNEAALPIVDSDALGNNLSAREFTQQFIPFLHAGESKQIQDYKCRFMVDVFDATSPNNKLGYKRNLKVLENIFYKFEENKNW